MFVVCSFRMRKIVSCSRFMFVCYLLLKRIFCQTETVCWNWNILILPSVSVMLIIYILTGELWSNSYMVNKFSIRSIWLYTQPKYINPMTLFNSYHIHVAELSLQSTQCKTFHHLCTQQFLLSSGHENSKQKKTGKMSLHANSFLSHSVFCPNSMWFSWTFDLRCMTILIPFW